MEEVAVDVAHERDRREAPLGRTSRRARLGLIVAPGVPARTASELRADLASEMARLSDDCDWEVALAVDRLVAPPAETTEIVDAARRRLLEEDWDLALFVTELALRVGRRPIADYSSSTHRVAGTSLPAIGRRRRLRDTLVTLVEELLQDADGAAGTQEVVAEVDPRRHPIAPLYALRVTAANARLLAGMIRANRPWRFALRLYRVLVTALATAVFALITGEVWQLADALGTGRLAAGTVAAVAVTAVTIVAAHGLWERAPSPRVRQDVVLFNMVTVVTVTVGVLFLYLSLFAVTLGITVLFVAPSVLEQSVGHQAAVPDYLELGWLISSIATVGGDWAPDWRRGRPCARPPTPTPTKRSPADAASPQARDRRAHVAGGVEQRVGPDAEQDRRRR
jgi:hypothetical protein